MVSFTFRPLYFRLNILLPIQWEVGWSPEPHWTLYRRDEWLPSAGNRKDISRSACPCLRHYTDYADHTRIFVVFKLETSQYFALNSQLTCIHDSKLNSVDSYILYIYIQGVTGGMDQTSGGCSLC